MATSVPANFCRGTFLCRFFFRFLCRLCRFLGRFLCRHLLCLHRHTGTFVAGGALAVSTFTICATSTVCGSSVTSSHVRSKTGFRKGIGPKSKPLAISSSKIMFFAVGTFGINLFGVNKDLAGTCQLGRCCADTLQFVFFFLPPFQKKDEAMTQVNEEMWKHEKYKMIGPHEQDFRVPAGYPTG